MAHELSFQFEKRFSEGVVIQADLHLSKQGPLVTVLFGPSGSGKTTILRCLAGLERPERGIIRHGDDTWYDASRGISLSPQERHIGHLFQDYALFPHLSVKRNLEYGLHHYGPEERKQRASALIDLFQLSGLENRYPKQLSGGQRQRVALARAVAPQPRLLLLDEPLSALDDPTRSRLRSELRSVLTSVGIRTLLVTHDRIEAIALGDQLAVVVDGRIQQVGPVQEVFHYPANHAVAQSVGVETVLPCVVVAEGDGLLTLQAGPIKLWAVDPGDVESSELYLCVRADEVMLERGGARRDSARNHLLGRINAMTPEGALVRVMLDCGVPLVSLVTRQACEELNLTEGESVTAVIKATSVHLVSRTAVSWAST